MNKNKQFDSLIKLRHLKKASQNNWEMLSNTKKMVNEIISDADQIMEKFGSSAGKEKFAIDAKTLSANINEIQESLNNFHLFIQGEDSVNPENSFKKFNSTLENTSNLFKNISSYPDTFFNDIETNEWSEIWDVIKSNMKIVQGVGESAYMKSLMIRNFNNEEVDNLTNEIVKHIPQSFNLLEAEKYKQEYLQAVKEIEQESNAKDNLWDRFLNVLAGGIPFKQSPEERVMMRRWLDGDLGEL